MSAKSIPIYLANLAIFKVKLSFWAPKTPLLDARDAQMRYDVIRYLRP